MLLLLVAARMQALQLVEAALQPIVEAALQLLKAAIVEAASDPKSVEKCSTNARRNYHD